MYTLRLKSDKSRVDSIKAKDMKEARFIFMTRKQMDKKSFDRIYEVTLDK